MVKPLCMLPKPFVVVQFYPWFKFYFLSFLGIEMYDNEFETKERKFEPRIKLSYNTFPYWDWDGLTPSLFEEVWERGPRHFSS